MSSAADLTGDLVAALALLAQSPYHENWRPQQVLNWVVAPLLLQQAILVREHGRLVALATWAFVDDDAHQALREHSRPLTLAEWNSGPNIWIVDFVAPHGHARLLARLLRKSFVAAGLGGKMAHRTRRYAPPPET